MSLFVNTNILNSNSEIEIQLENNLKKWENEKSDKNEKMEKRDSKFFFWKRKSTPLKQ